MSQILSKRLTEETVSLVDGFYLNCVLAKKKRLLKMRDDKRCVSY